MVQEMDFSAMVKMQSYAKYFTTSIVDKSGVTVNEFYALIIIQKYSPCTWFDLLREFDQATTSATTHSLRSRLSRVVKKLEQKGLVQSRQSLTDHRYQLLGLTTAGDQMLVQVKQKMTETLDQYATTVDDFFPVKNQSTVV